jgi:hypothetical protein
MLVNDLDIRKRSFFYSDEPSPAGRTGSNLVPVFARDHTGIAAYASRLIEVKYVLHRR